VHLFKTNKKSPKPAMRLMKPPPNKHYATNYFSLPRSEGFMKAVVYKGPYEVAVEDVEDPAIQAPTDVIVRITSTAICGSDLHMYEGRPDAEPGLTFSYESTAFVEAVGS